MKFAFPPLTPVVRATLIVLFASFVLQSLAEGVIGLEVSTWLALRTEIAIRLAWQWATYPLVELPGPGAVLSRALDLLLIYSFGGYVESAIGRGRTLALGLVAVVGGAILPLVFGLLFPSFAWVLAGASAITWALMGAFAVVTRGAPMGFFLMPTMSAWYVIGIFLVIVALESMWLRTPMPFFAAISALAAGVLFTRWTERRPPVPKAPAKRRAGASHLQVIPGGAQDDDRPRWLN